MAHIGFRGGIKGKSWFYKVFLGRHPVTKEKKYKFKRKFHTKKAAERAARKLEVERDTGKIVFVEKLTVDEYMWDWFNYHSQESKGKTKEIRRKREKKRKWKPATIGNHRVAIENYIVPFFGQTLLIELERHHIEDWVDEMVENGGLSGEGIAQGTAKIQLNTLSTGLKDAVERKLITSNPAGGVTVPDTEESMKKKTERIVVDPKMIKKILDQAKGSRYYLALRLAFYYGFRRGELAGLRWTSVSLDDLWYIVVRDNRTEGDGKVVEGTPKTLSSNRHVAIGKQNAALLSAHKAEQRKEFEALGMPWSEDGYVFVKSNGKPPHPKTFYINAKRFAERAGYPDFTMHFARHVSGSIMMEETSLKVAQETLGHASAGITADIYGHPLTGQAEDAAHKMEDRLDME